MHLVEEHYNTLNVPFSKVLGIWPYNRSRFVLLQNVLVILLTVPHLCLQFSVFFTTEYTMTLFIRVMTIACPTGIISLAYIAFLFKLKSIINLHNQIQEDWLLLRDKLETKILQKTVHDHHMYILLLFFYSVLIIVGMPVLQFFPVVLDIVFPLDEPRPQKIFIMVEYFVFDNKYFYFKVLHEVVFVAVCGTILFVVASQMLVFFFHALGLFKIARHRIEYSVEECVWHVSGPKKEHAICERIMHAVIAHRRALEFSYFMISSFNAMYCIVAILLVISLSINLYGIVEATTVKDWDIVFLCVICSLGIVGYMLIAFYFDQKIIDSHNEIFHAICTTSWYLMPVSSQKLILILLQKAGKEFYIKIGFVFVLKIESFAMLLNSSLSYVAVMYSVNQK